MKKIISMVLVVIMLATLMTACGKKNSDFVAVDAADLLQEAATAEVHQEAIDDKNFKT